MAADADNTSQAETPDPQKLIRLFREGNHPGVLTAANSLQPSGEIHFLAGMAAYRSACWAEAEKRLALAAAEFPLLADYADIYRAKALESLNRPLEMIAPLDDLLSRYKESRMKKEALFMKGNAYFSSGSWAQAISIYQSYISLYPSGTDAITASFRMALCREKQGDREGAFLQLRTLWLTAPSSAAADEAAKEMDRMVSEGATRLPYKPEELFKRAVTLYDLKSWEAALKQLQWIPLNGQTPEFISKVQFKTGQTLFRNKHYKEAEAIFSRLEASEGKKAETLYWLARTLAKNDTSTAAIAAYLSLVSAYPTSELADDALYQAAIVARDTSSWQEAVTLLTRLITEYPKSERRAAALWELGFGAYRKGNLQPARDFLNRLKSIETHRKQSLYWLARLEEQSGDREAAAATAKTLLTEYPFDYYALSWQNRAAAAPNHLPAIPLGIKELLASPSGFEREKRLISYGMHDEAASELKQNQKNGNGKSAAGAARLYLEMENYNGAFHLAKKIAGKQNGSGLVAWALSYPPAYSDAVMLSSSKQNLPPSLAFAIMRTESSYHPGIISPAGAVGLMQLMPNTAGMMLKEKKPVIIDLLKNPSRNIDLGIRHLKDLLIQYKGERIFAIAAYNAGSGNVDRWRKRFGALPDDLFVEQIPFAETREYVKKVLAAESLYSRLYPSLRPAAPARVEEPSPFTPYSSVILLP